MDKKLPAEPLMDAETDEVPGYQFTNPAFLRIFSILLHNSFEFFVQCLGSVIAARHRIDCTGFERPGFQKMLDEIEAGHVSTVIVKDLSRFGRNSALTGMYTNITFAKYGVKVCIHD